MTEKELITFGDLGISDDLLRILNAKNLINPTPIQEQCISLGMEGKDIVGIAQTGTGKTLAFGLPIIEQILKGEGQAIIMLPTRELAIQVEEVLYELGKRFKLRTALLIGGVSSRPQKQALKENPDIIVATPGRLIDHIHQGYCRLHNTNIVVLDEADRMLDIGFMPQIREILQSIPEQRQTMLFSATMPKEIAQLSTQYMKDPVRIEVSPAGTSAQNIEQAAYIVRSEKKNELLSKTIFEHKGSILVFTRTKYKAKSTAAYLKRCNISAIEMHSNRSLAQRKEALAGFKSGRYRVLVATDVAARGLDVDDISLVINFNLPDVPDDYVHRIGRTGRAGKEGKAIAFIEPNESSKLRIIERLIKKELTIIEGSQAFSTSSDRRPKKSSSRPQWKKKNSSSNDGRMTYDKFKQQSREGQGQRRRSRSRA